MTTTILLGGGYHSLIDMDDLERVSKHRWTGYRNDRGYVYARGRVNGKSAQLHRFLLGAVPGEQVDHINGDTLDNRRCNLRKCTHAENMRNSRKPKSHAGKRTTTPFKGVYRTSGAILGWRAEITVDRKHVHLGTFAWPEDAARAYDEAARSLHGEFARLNFPEAA